MTTMQRTNTRLIKLPSLLIPAVNYTGDSDSAEELNVKAYDYVRRTAVPTLEDYVITTFGDALKEKTFNEAVQKYGVDAKGILICGSSSTFLMQSFLIVSKLSTFIFSKNS